jgi:hypothetical protein
MSQVWGPALDAELEYRRSKLTKVAAAGRRNRRRAGQPTVRLARGTEVRRPRAA